MAKLTCNFISYTLGRTIDITAIIPSITMPESMCRNHPENAGIFKKGPVRSDASYIDQPPLPVLYLLHGGGNNHATWAGYTNIELYAEERQVAVIMMSGENKSFINFGNNDRLYDFINNELHEFIRWMFPVSHRREDTFIAGLSMGGFGALIHGLSSPEKYAAIGSFSPVVELRVPKGFADDSVEKYPSDPPLEYARKIWKANGPFPKIYLACGQNDGLLPPIVVFKDQLLEMGFDVSWNEVPGFDHEWRFWNEQIEKFLDWLPRTDAYAKMGKRVI